MSKNADIYIVRTTDQSEFAVAHANENERAYPCLVVYGVDHAAYGYFSSPFVLPSHQVEDKDGLKTALKKEMEKAVDRNIFVIVQDAQDYLIAALKDMNIIARPINRKSNEPVAVIH